MSSYSDPVVGLIQSSYTVREGTDEMVSVCAVLQGPPGGLSREFTVTLSASAGTAGERIIVKRENLSCYDPSCYVMNMVTPTEPESDYSATEYSVTRTFRTFITVGSTHQRCFQPNITDDNIGETTEGFSVNLSSSNSRVLIQNGQSVATVIIVDDDSE